MENDSIVTPNVIRPPLNIPRRPVNYIPNPGGGGEGNSGRNGESGSREGNGNNGKPNGNGNSSNGKPNGNGNSSNGKPDGNISEPFREHRKLLLFVGDMVKVIDPKSHLVGKYGLVEEIAPRNPQYQVIMRIGAIRNPVKFNQLRFCTRISPTINNGLKNNSPKNNGPKFEEEDDKRAINELIDVVDEEADNAGNCEGSNLKHGKKL